MSTNTWILAILVMIYAHHAKKATLIMKNEELVSKVQNAIDVYQLQDFITMTKISGVSAFLGKHQLKQEMTKEHMEKLLEVELATLLSQLLAIYVLMDV
jgi:hypothetical protein